MGESTGFDEDSDEESEEEEEETKEDFAFIDDEDLEEEDDLSFYRRVDLQLPEQQSISLPPAPVQPTNPLLKKIGPQCVRVATVFLFALVCEYDVVEYVQLF